MGSFSQVSVAYLNGLFKQKELIFKRMEFERGLGIVNDAFYLTLESNNGTAFIKINTNVRAISRGRVILRYHDLFLKSDGKRISKSEYRSQKEIEKTALFANLNLLNDHFVGRRIKAVTFSRFGDLRISLTDTDFIVSNDDLDISKRGRCLYEIVFIDFTEDFGIVLSERERTITVKKLKHSRFFLRMSGAAFVLLSESSDLLALLAGFTKRLCAQLFGLFAN